MLNYVTEVDKVVICKVCHANYVGDKSERKRTSDGCHLIGSILILWMSKKQGAIALLSNTYQILIIVHNCCG